MVRLLSPDDGNSLREQILVVINSAKVLADDAVKILSQCQSHFQNRMIIERVAKECGLKLTRFLTNKHLELYFDLKQVRLDMGYISKGWDDPGFRVGNIVNIPKDKIMAFKKNAYSLLQFCAVQGVAMTVQEQEGSAELHMDSVIYSEGFNKRVLEQVLEQLNVCVNKAKNLIG